MLYCYNAQLGLGAGLDLTRLERLSALWRKKTPADLQGRTPPWPWRGYSCSNLSTRIYGNPLRWYFQKERVCNNSLGRQENTLISVFLLTLIILSFMLIQYHVFTTYFEARSTFWPLLKTGCYRVSLLLLFSNYFSLTMVTKSDKERLVPYCVFYVFFVLFSTSKTQHRRGDY